MMIILKEKSEFLVVLNVYEKWAKTLAYSPTRWKCLQTDSTDKVKQITPHVSSLWHLLVGGVYWAVSEHIVFKLIVLEAETIVKHKDLRTFEKGQIVMTCQC